MARPKGSKNKNPYMSSQGGDAVSAPPGDSVTGSPPGADPLPELEPDLSKANPYLIQRLASTGMTLTQMAHFFGVDYATLYNYRKENPGLFAVLHHKAKDQDARIVRSLVELAEGFKMAETKVFCHQGKITKEDVIRQFPPNIEAIKTYLYNRMAGEWADKREVKQSGGVKQQIILDSPLFEMFNKILPKLGEEPIKLPKSTDPESGTSPTLLNKPPLKGSVDAVPEKQLPENLKDLEEMANKLEEVEKNPTESAPPAAPDSNHGTVSGKADVPAAGGAMKSAPSVDEIFPETDELPGNVSSGPMLDLSEIEK